MSLGGEVGGGGGGALKLVSKTGLLSWAHKKCCHKPEQFINPSSTSVRLA